MQTIAIYKFLLPFSYILSVITIVISLKQIRLKQYPFFFLYLVCANGILIGKTAEFYATTEAISLMTGKITYAFIAFLGVFWLLFIMQWTHHAPAKLIRRILIPLSIIPVATIVLQSTNSLHHLVWKAHHFEVRDGHLINIITDYGPWFYVHSIYSYGLFLIGGVVLCVENSDLWKTYKIRSTLIILGIACPVMMNLMYVLRDTRVAFWDFSSASYAFTAFLYTVAIWKYGLFTLPQPSRKHILNNLKLGITTVTPDGTVIDITKQAVSQFGTRNVIGRNISSFLQEEDGSFFRVQDYLSEDRKRFCLCNSEKLSIEVTEHKDNDDTVAYIIITKPVHTDKIPPRDTDSCSYTAAQMYDAVYRKAVEENLSNRELEVLKELLGTAPNKVIAENLNISVETVHTHTSRILKKLKCRNRAELREYVLSLMS